MTERHAIFWWLPRPPIQNEGYQTRSFLLYQHFKNERACCGHVDTGKVEAANKQKKLENSNLSIAQSLNLPYFYMMATLTLQSLQEKESSLYPYYGCTIAVHDHVTNKHHPAYNYFLYSICMVKSMYCFRKNHQMMGFPIRIHFR